MQLSLHVHGCVKGFEYQLFAVVDSNQLQTWDHIFVCDTSGKLHLNATFANPEKCEPRSHRVQVALFDLYANLSLVERKVAAREGELKPQVEVISPSALPMSYRMQEADQLQESLAVPSVLLSQQGGEEETLPDNPLFVSLPAPVSSIRQYHRERLELHFAHLRQLDHNALWIPAVWWFQRPAAYTFYHQYISHLLHPELHFYEGQIPWREFPRIHGLMRKQYHNTKPAIWRYVLEDLHIGGRGLAGDEAHAANEVFVSEKYRIVYVVARKCASTAITHFMKTHLNASCHSCNHQQCPLIFNRCTSMCLNSNHLLNRRYLLFSFVQHPVRRFFKAMTTILSKSTLESDNVDTLALRILTLLQEKSHAVDHHLVTLSFSLSSETAEKLMPQVELDCMMYDV